MSILCIQNGIKNIYSVDLKTSVTMPLLIILQRHINIKNINILFAFEVDVHNKCCNHSLLKPGHILIPSVLNSQLPVPLMLP